MHQIFQVHLEAVSEFSFGLPKRPKHFHFLPPQIRTKKMKRISSSSKQSICFTLTLSSSWNIFISIWFGLMPKICASVEWIKRPNCPSSMSSIVVPHNVCSKSAQGEHYDLWCYQQLLLNFPVSLSNLKITQKIESKIFVTLWCEAWNTIPFGAHKESFQKLSC